MIEAFGREVPSQLQNHLQCVKAAVC